MNGSPSDIKKLNRMSYMSWLAAGIVIIIAATVLGVLWPGVETLQLYLWPAGAAALLVSLVEYIRYLRKPGMPREDERTRKIRGTAMTGAWFISWLFVSLLGALNAFGVVRMSTAASLGAVSVFMVVAGVGLFYIFSMKGDVA